MSVQFFNVRSRRMIVLGHNVFIQAKKHLKSQFDKVSQLHPLAI